MRYRWLGALIVALPFAISVAETKPLTIDTPIVDLVLDPRTRPVVERFLPNLTQKLLNDAQAMELLGGSSPRELALDPHVRGINDDLLKRLQEALLEAQQKLAK